MCEFCKIKFKRMFKVLLILTLCPLISYAQSDSVFSISFDVVHKVSYLFPNAKHKAEAALNPIYITEHCRKLVLKNGDLYGTQSVYFLANETIKQEKYFAIIKNDSLYNFDVWGQLINRQLATGRRVVKGTHFVTYYYASPFFHNLSFDAVNDLYNQGYCLSENSDSVVCFSTDSSSDYYDIQNLVHQYTHFKKGVNVYIKTTIYQPGLNQDLTIEYEIERIPFYWKGEMGQKIVIKHYFNVVRNFYDLALLPKLPPELTMVPHSNYRKRDADPNDLFSKTTLNYLPLKMFTSEDIDAQLKSLGRIYGNIILNGLGDDEN